MTSLQLNENLQTIDYINNPIYEIINSDDTDNNDNNDYTYIYNNDDTYNNDDIDKINQKLRVLNQFRHLYYSLKFKKRFSDWLWVKIREPKMREKYQVV